jgi:hydrogenase nickel incorporation protein HypA/HybF
MHELSVATAVLNTALKHADGRRVTLVSVEVGALRQVVPESLRFYWAIVARDTACEGASLELVEVDARLRCRDCHREWSPDLPVFRCPDCAGAEVEVSAGEQLSVDHIEVAAPSATTTETEAACTAPR